MDDENMSDLNRLAPKGSRAKLLLLGEFDPNKERIIRDPYYVSGGRFSLISVINFLSLLGFWCRRL